MANLITPPPHSPSGLFCPSLCRRLLHFSSSSADTLQKFLSCSSESLKTKAALCASHLAFTTFAPSACVCLCVRLNTCTCSIYVRRLRHCDTSCWRESHHNTSSSGAQTCKVTCTLCKNSSRKSRLIFFALDRVSHTRPAGPSLVARHVFFCGP